MFTNLKPIYTSSLSKEMYGLYKLCNGLGYKEYSNSEEYKQAEAYGVYKTPTREFLVPLYSECTIDPITIEDGTPILNIGSALAEYSTKNGFVSTFGNDFLFIIKE